MPWNDIFASFFKIFKKIENSWKKRKPATKWRFFGKTAFLEKSQQYSIKKWVQNSRNPMLWPTKFFKNFHNSYKKSNLLTRTKIAKNVKKRAQNLLFSSFWIIFGNFFSVREHTKLWLWKEFFFCLKNMYRPQQQNPLRTVSTTRSFSNRKSKNKLFGAELYNF